MRYPNLRYSWASEFENQVNGRPIKEIAKQLRRSERSVNDWLNGKKKVPWWVPEILRLYRMEHADMLRSMQIYQLKTVSPKGKLLHINVKRKPPKENRTTISCDAAQEVQLKRAAND